MSFINNIHNLANITISTLVHDKNLEFPSDLLLYR